MAACPQASLNRTSSYSCHSNVTVRVETMIDEQLEERLTRLEQQVPSLARIFGLLERRGTTWSTKS